MSQPPIFARRIDCTTIRLKIEGSFYYATDGRTDITELGVRGDRSAPIWRRGEAATPFQARLIAAAVGFVREHG